LLKTIFFGTPDTAVPFLHCLADASRVLGVVTAPDKPSGRGYAPAAPPVKNAALERSLPVLQPSSLRDQAVSGRLRDWGNVDLGIVVAYGYKIPREVFSHPRLGLVNVHFSLLPDLRGAAPIQRALMRGDTRTGVSLFQIEEGLDTGPVYAREEVAIEAADDAAALKDKLVRVGVDLLRRSLSRFESGEWTPAPQTGEPTLAPSLKKEEGLLRWDRLSAREALNVIRGTYEWPQAFTYMKGRLLKIRRAEVRHAGDGLPGEIVGVERGKGFLIKCREGSLLALRVQPEGKKEMDAWGYWNGARLEIGARFDDNLTEEKKA
jgi:methionyl-tRNA formyltransferase